MSRANDLLNQKSEIEKFIDQEVYINENEFINELNQNKNELSLPIKVLIILGGILSGLLFIGFLGVAGILDSELGLLVLSMISFAFAFFIEVRFHNKIVLNAFNLTLYLIGFSTLGASLGYFDVDYSLNLTILIILSFVVLAFSKNHITTFIATLGVNFLFFLLIINNKYYDLFNIQVIALLFIKYVLFFSEGTFIKYERNYRKMYFPFRSGITISLVGILAVLGFNKLVELDLQFLWISSGVIILLIGYLFYTTEIFGTSQKTKKTQAILAILVLSPLIFAPAVLGGLFITLLAFRTNYTTGLTLGIACFLYFIGQYYYDLKMTLFFKSLLMMGTGLLFLMIQFILHKKNLFHDND